MRYLTLTFVLAFLLFGCPSEPKDPEVKAAPDTNLCGQMCDYLVQLGCDEGKALYDSDVAGQRGIPNETCEQFCTKAQLNGIWINPKCVMKAPSCLDIETYRAKRCE